MVLARDQRAECSGPRRMIARADCTLKDEGACFTVWLMISWMRESGMGDELVSS